MRVDEKLFNKMRLCDSALMDVSPLQHSEEDLSVVLCCKQVPLIMSVVSNGLLDFLSCTVSLIFLVWYLI